MPKEGPVAKLPLAIAVVFIPVMPLWPNGMPRPVVRASKLFTNKEPANKMRRAITLILVERCCEGMERVQMTICSKKSQGLENSAHVMHMAAYQ